MATQMAKMRMSVTCSVGYANLSSSASRGFNRRRNPHLQHLGLPVFVIQYVGVQPPQQPHIRHRQQQVMNSGESTAMTTETAANMPTDCR